MATQPVTMETFESIVDNHELVILDFWASWCKPCQTFAPIFEELSNHHPEIFFGKVDTEASPALAEAFQVRSIPTIMAFVKTDLVFEQAGILPPAVMLDLIAKLKLKKSG